MENTRSIEEEAAAAPQASGGRRMCYKRTVLAKHCDRHASPLSKSVKEKQENNPPWCHFSDYTHLVSPECLLSSLSEALKL